MGASQAASGEEALTAAVVAAYASVDEATAKREGPLLAAKVLPARRELWRLAEMYEPRRLADALRARCDPSDQSGRGGVRELREALADWLDPPKRCRVCRRPIRAGTELVGCPGLPQRTGRFGRALMRKPCRAPPGHPLKYNRAHGNRDCNGRMKDGLTFSLFSPVQLDTSANGCAAAAAKLAKHGGGAAYDLVVDRDCRILFAAVRLPPAPRGERAGPTCLADGERDAAPADLEGLEAACTVPPVVSENGLEFGGPPRGQADGRPPASGTGRAVAAGVNQLHLTQSMGASGLPDHDASSLEPATQGRPGLGVVGPVLPSLAFQVGAAPAGVTEDEGALVVPPGDLQGDNEGVGAVDRRVGDGCLHGHHPTPIFTTCQATLPGFPDGLDCHAYAPHACSVDPPAKRSPAPAGIHPLVLGALRRMDRAMDKAMRANGRLVLGVQSRYFSPKGSVTRADLLQGGADGLRRALLDYDPNFKPAGKKSGVAISTYAINWIYQGCGAVFSGRDLVDVPDWARRLRRDVEDLGVDPGVLHGAIDAAVEAWGVPEEGGPGTRPEGLTEGCAALAALIARGFTQVAAKNPPLCLHPARPRSPAHVAVLGIRGRGRMRDRGAFALGSALWDGATAKKGGQAERVRERLAACMGVLLGLDCKGPALLTALRHGAAQVVSEVGTGERSDGEGDGAGGGGHGGDSGGGRHGRLDRAAEHLREEADDAEARAAKEQEAGQRRRAAYAALERVRERDPEAAEVVRRRHGLDGAGEPETFEALAAAPLRCSGRRMCRESLRKLYVAATREMSEVAPDLLGATAVADIDTAATVTMQEHHETAGAAHAPTDAAMAAVRTFAARRAAIEGHRSAAVIRRPARPKGTTSREQFGLLAGPPPVVAQPAPDDAQAVALDLAHALA
jgi:hypothetical protein